MLSVTSSLDGRSSWRAFNTETAGLGMLKGQSYGV